MYIIEDITEENTKETIQSIICRSGMKNIEITLSTHGGCAKSAILIGHELQKLKDSGTHIKITCVGVVASAGTYFLQYADELVTDNCIFMAHKCYDEFYGNKSEVSNRLKLCDFYDEKVFNAVKEFLTEEQQEEYKKGLDVYFTI